MRIRLHTLLAIVVAVALTAACSDTPVGPNAVEVSESSFARIQVTTAVVHPIMIVDEVKVPDFSLDLGDSRIIRTAGGINVHLTTTGLTPGNAYTLWAVIFNDGDPTNEVLFVNKAVRVVAGHVADGSGKGTFSGRIKAHDGGGELLGELTNPVGAEVHLEVRNHGPADPAFMPGQIHSFGGGCTPASSFGFGDGLYVCTDDQVAIHPSAS